MMEPLTPEKAAEIRAVSERMARAMPDDELVDELAVNRIVMETLRAEARRRGMLSDGSQTSCEAAWHAA